MQTEPSPADPPSAEGPHLDDWWVCLRCRSVNRAATRRCYACGVSRSVDGQPVTSTRSRRVAVAVAVSGVSLALIAAGLWSVRAPAPAVVPSAPTHADATPSPSAPPAIAVGPSATPIGPAVYKVGQPVAVAGVEIHTVLRVEVWPGRDPAPTGERYLAVEVNIQANRGQTPRFDQMDYAVAIGSGAYRNALLLGRNPQLGSGTAALGRTVRAWVTFQVPGPGPFTLLYEYPLGENGQVVKTTIRLDPISKPTPEPTPQPTPRSTPGSQPPGSPANWGYPNAIRSTYYSGYGVISPTAQTVTFISGSWTQPRITCDGGSSTRLMAIWVGIEDSAGNDLQQLGTGAECDPGSTVPQYYAWFEMFPSPTVLVAIPVRPGDRFAASVQRRGSVWTLKLTNRTTGKGFSTNRTRATPGTVALWIVEAPSTQSTDPGMHVVPLAKYATVTVSSCQAVVAGVRGTIGAASWAHIRFDMATTGGLPKATTGGLRSSGSSFSSTWRHQ